MADCKCGNCTCDKVTDMSAEETINRICDLQAELDLCKDVFETWVEKHDRPMTEKEFWNFENHRIGLEKEIGHLTIKYEAMTTY